MTRGALGHLVGWKLRACGHAQGPNYQMYSESFLPYSTVFGDMVDTGHGGGCPVWLACTFGP